VLTLVLLLLLLTLLLVLTRSSLSTRWAAWTAWRRASRRYVLLLFTQFLKQIPAVDPAVNGFAKLGAEDVIDGVIQVHKEIT